MNPCGLMPRSCATASMRDSDSPRPSSHIRISASVIGSPRSADANQTPMA